LGKKNQMKMLLIVIQGAQFSAGPIHTTPEKFKNATITGHFILETTLSSFCTLEVKKICPSNLQIICPTIFIFFKNYLLI